MVGKPPVTGHRTDARTAVVVVDLGHGDQGKGSVTDFLVRAHEAHTVVRYNGGAQAGHNVVTPDGRHHTFSQFGAGTFVPGVQTVLSDAMAIHPWAMVVEAAHLARNGVTDAFDRTLVSEQALVITPFHGAANRLRERARGRARHGSCGIGMGEAVTDALSLGRQDVLRAGDLADTDAVVNTLRRIQGRKRSELAEVIRATADDPDAATDHACLNDPSWPGSYATALTDFVRVARIVDARALARALGRAGTVVLEGAQGVLLDEWRGFHPHTTWSRCTDHPATAFLSSVGWQGAVRRLGLVRAYATRHGAGPLPTEDPGLTARVSDTHNVTHPWQGGFRVGWFDAVATRYALRVCDQIDALAVTCLDRIAAEPSWRLAAAYEVDGQAVRDLPVGPWQDLAHQQRLTDQLLRATPVYEHAGDGDADRLAAIETSCGRRVVLVSTGPTATHKRWLAAL